MSWRKPAEPVTVGDDGASEVVARATVEAEVGEAARGPRRSAPVKVVSGLTCRASAGVFDAAVLEDGVSEVAAGEVGRSEKSVKPRLIET